MEFMLRKMEAEGAAKAKKLVLPNKLQAALNAGGGYVNSPIVRQDFTENEQEVLRGLEVRSPSNDRPLNPEEPVND